MTIDFSGTTADGCVVEVSIPDAGAFEALRIALDDPLWLLGATWELLEANEYKRGRLVDALQAWLSHLDKDRATTLLTRSGAEVREP